MQQITIRPMRLEDIPKICQEEAAQGWHPDPEKYQMRIRDMTRGISIAWVSEYHGEIAGYINLYRTPCGGPFSNMPEVVDLGVFQRFQHQGIGTALMDVAEAQARQWSQAVCIGVGLHSGYGSAQRMYIKRGYLPDGSGVWFRGAVCPQYAPCINDDDLILYLSKSLS